MPSTELTGALTPCRASVPRTSQGPQSPHGSTQPSGDCGQGRAGAPCSAGVLPSLGTRRGARERQAGCASPSPSGGGEHPASAMGNIPRTGVPDAPGGIPHAGAPCTGPRTSSGAFGRPACGHRGCTPLCLAWLARCRSRRNLSWRPKITDRLGSSAGHRGCHPGAWHDMPDAAAEVTCLETKPRTGPGSCCRSPAGCSCK